jgi:hypothetical protein
MAGVHREFGEMVHLREGGEKSVSPEAGDDLAAIGPRAIVAGVHAIGLRRRCLGEKIKAIIESRIRKEEEAS